MKNSIGLTVVSFIIFNLATVSSPANAETLINVSNNSSDTESEVSVKTINGKSTVCINGECTTYEGDVDIKTENGKTNIKVNNTTRNATSSSGVKEQNKKETTNEVIKKVQKERFEIMKFLQYEIESLKRFFAM